MKRTAFIAIAIMAACSDPAEPRAQWKITLATDAPIPTLGDRVLIELLNHDGSLACSACRRQLGASDAAAWPMSFGVAKPSDGRALRLRARLFRADSSGPAGLPVGNTVIDALGHLPEPQGVTPVSIELRMSCFGIQSDLAGDRTCDPDTRSLAPAPTLAASSELPAASSWPPAGRTPCNGAVPAGMRCVEGGAFLLGSSSDPAFLSLSSTPERLVQLHAFALDVDEVTVGEVRNLVQLGKLPTEPIAFLDNYLSIRHACRYLGADDTGNDAFPINCISRGLAELVCEARGAVLPTEAQWEFAATNRGTRRVYPWGNEADICQRAVVGRGRSIIANAGEDSSCIGDEPGPAVPGPLAGGFDSDKNELGLRNMAGNVAEWLQDGAEGYEAECWHPEIVPLVDPVCAPSAAPALAAHRGGAWNLPPLFARARLRDGGPPFPGDVGLGFRCALPMP